MNSKKIIVAILAAAMSANLCACSGGSDNTSEASSVSSDSSASSERIEALYSSDTAFSELSATKIGTFNYDMSDIQASKSALCYKTSDGKYGIAGIDGSSDTGAIYTYCTRVKDDDYKDDNYNDWFQVTTTAEEEISGIASKNCYGVVDKDGNEIVPMQYATVKAINERYIKVCEISGKTTSDADDAIVYTSDDGTLYPDDTDTYYSGKWYIYDGTTGKIVDGASGTKNSYIEGFGNFIKYETDNGEYVTVNNNGDKLPDGATLLDNGCYTLTSGNTAALYDSDGKKLFDYDINGYVPTKISGDYYVANMYEDGEGKYVLMDSTGDTVSAIFTDVPTVYGNVVESGDMAYAFDGSELVSDKVSNVYFDEYFKDACVIYTQSDKYVIYKDGEMVFSGSKSDYTFNSSYFTLHKKTDGDYYYFSLNDKDFTLEGSSPLAPWLIKAEANNNLCDVVDTNTGKSIIINYSNYSASYCEGGKMYIFAESSDESFDVYEISTVS